MFESEKIPTNHKYNWVEIKLLITNQKTKIVIAPITTTPQLNPSSEESKDQVSIRNMERQNNKNKKDLLQHLSNSLILV